jgi:hypothetical protein
LGADGAKIFILVAVRQNEKEPLPHGHGLPAAGTKEGTGFKLIVGSLLLLFRAGTTG